MPYDSKTLLSYFVYIQHNKVVKHAVSETLSLDIATNIIRAHIHCVFRYGSKNSLAREKRARRAREFLGLLLFSYGFFK